MGCTVRSDVCDVITDFMGVHKIKVLVVDGDSCVAASESLVR